MLQNDVGRTRIIRMGGMLGILLGVFFSIVWITAVLVNGDWTFGSDTLSELGGQVPSRWIFNIGVIVTGLIALFFFLAFGIHLSPSRIGRIGSYVLIAASIALISVGILPIDTGDPHEWVSVAFFGIAGIAFIILLYPIARKAGVVSWQMAITLGALAISIVTLLTTEVAFGEAIAVISLLVWSITMGIWMLNDIGEKTLKKDDELTRSD